MRGRFCWALTLLALTLVACTPVPAPGSSGTDLDPPCPVGSRWPTLTGSGDRLILTWLEGEAGQGRVRFSRFQRGRWSEPRLVVADPDLLSNWADRPAVVALADDSLAAHWLLRQGAASGAYEIRIAFSSDDGTSWSAPRSVHPGGIAAEFGFVAWAIDEQGGADIVWLDGRGHAGGDGKSRLMQRRWDGRELSEERVLDDDVCTCCPTDAIRDGERLLVVYRDRSEANVRDIALAVLSDSGRLERQTVHDDGWTLDACPVNGPSIVLAGEALAVGWYTGAEDRPAVQVAFSGRGADLSTGFTDPLRLDNDQPVGRLALIGRTAGGVDAAWLERIDGEPKVRRARVSPDGSITGRIDRRLDSTGRGVGFPQLARVEGGSVLAWTDIEPEFRVRAIFFSDDSPSTAH